MINAKKMLMSTQQKVETFWEIVKRYVWPMH